MRLLVILSVAAALTLASGSRLNAGKRRRESKWDTIHHEYHGPPAPLAKDGRVIDTQEVAIARANHLAIHAETVIDLARKMAEANGLDAKWGHEEVHKAPAATEAEAAPEAAPEAPIVAAPVEMTPELMAMLMEAAAVEEPKLEEEVKVEEVPAAEPAPVVEVEAPAAEALPEAEAIVAAEPEPAAAPEQPAAAEAAPAEPAAEEPKEAKKEEEKKEEKKEEKEEKKKEEKKEEEEKPVVEAETNEVDFSTRPYIIYQPIYGGPLAPLGEDGRVLDTPEVRKAKEAHLFAYEQAVKLAKAEAEAAKEGAVAAPAWYHQMRKRIYVPPVHLLYNFDGPIGYTGPSAPIGKHGKVVDTAEVERAKANFRRAYEHAEELAKLHPPKPQDNSV